MKIHKVKPGEYLASIAKQYKIASWKLIYGHADNADFRRKRPNPNVICPGDRIVIPDLEKRWEKGAAEQRHRFRALSPKLLIRIKLRDEDGEPLANKAYTLRLDDQEIEGSTDGDGLLEEEIPVGTHDAELHLTELDMTLPLSIGALDPVDDEDDSKIVSGAQARLNNLGFNCGKVDGHQGPRTAAAVRAFQEQVLERAEPDGELDSETRRKLVSEHGT